MKNVSALKHTGNISDSVATEERGVDHSLSYLTKDKKDYALNLISDWRATVRHLTGLNSKTIETHYNNLERLLRLAKVAPWELTPKHVVDFFESKVDPKTNLNTISESTHAVYCSSWRSFQSFMLDPERVVAIQKEFGIRPTKFINDENSIAIKRYKANKEPKGWSLTPEQIDLIDKEFQTQIVAAFRSRSKALLPLQRDRVMFHIAIHFALRVSELVTVCLSSFNAHHDPRLARFENFGALTLTGKNSVTGAVPMREPAIFDLLTWYMSSVRQTILLRRKNHDATCVYDDKTYQVSDLMFPSERGGVVCPNGFRKRLKTIAIAAGVDGRRLTPHTLRHTGCTMMVPVYSPEITQKYMRHKNLFTTLGYYHPTPLDAASEANAAFYLFDDEE
jgi:site-specific recombinase XerD